MSQFSWILKSICSNYLRASFTLFRWLFSQCRLPQYPTIPVLTSYGPNSGYDLKCRTLLHYKTQNWTQRKMISPGFGSDRIVLGCEFWVLSSEFWVLGSLGLVWLSFYSHFVEMLLLANTGLFVCAPSRVLL